MTDPFPGTEPVEPCGCPKGAGHRCDPPFVAAKANVPCPVCGADRWVTNQPSAIARTGAVQCWACYRTSIAAEQKTTWMVPCVVCGVERAIYGFARDRVAAEERACSPTCWQADQDEMAVERLLAGHPPVRTTRAERQAAVAHLTRRGTPTMVIAERLRVTRRTVERLRARCAA